MPNKFFPNKLKSWWQQRFKQDTLDWRSLSPHHPPLPFLLSNTVDEPLNDSTPIQHHSNIILDSISNIHPSKVKNKPFHSLFPILEESETIITEEVRQETTQRKSPETSSTCSPVPSNIGDEEKCKQRFVNMVLAAKQSHQSNLRPTEMSLVFDLHGNIDTVQMTIQGQSIQQKFDGNPQCIPPEVATSTEYKSEQAEVWILGIYLYKMLTGKYPFHASNHQQLLKRMLHTSFSLPNDLSEDAKDILRRMLAPDIITRASLDLIIYHPWLQPYRHLLVEQSLPIQQDPTPKVIKKKKKIKPFKQAVLFIFHGPFPPPKKPYQDLSHLGTRESVFARQRQL